MAPSGGEPRVAVIGGGIAGLVAAYYLGRAGVPADLYEAEEETGGLARSFDLDGLQVERYYHFICRPDHELIGLARELGLGGQIIWRPTRTSFFYQGRLYPFTSPLDLARFSPIPWRARINLGLQTLKWQNLREWQKLDAIPARQWLIEHLGERTYEVVWSPLLEMKFGEAHDQVSAAWLWHRVQRVANSRKSPLHPQVMGHFQGGTETLLRRLRERIAESGGRIFCRTPAQAVIADPAGAGRVRAVRVAGEERPCSAAVMAVPLPQAARLLPPELADYRPKLEQVAFLGVVCLALSLDRSITDSFWCNIHDDRIPMNGIIEMSRLNPETGRGGGFIYVPYYLPVTSPRFSFSDEQILAEALQALPLLQPGLDRSAVRGYRVFRSRLAQAVCTTGFRFIQPPLELPLPGLFLIDSTQQYPSDRTLSGMIGLADQVSRLVLAHRQRKT